MTIRKKISDKSLDRIISKGGHVTADLDVVKPEWTTLCLRITSELIRNIDEIKSVGTSRNAWILSVIEKELEKLK